MDPSSKHLHRASETTSSVRLRRRKDEVQQGLEGAQKRRNRHSGDFLYWPAAAIQGQQQQQQQQQQQSQMSRRSQGQSSHHHQQYRRSGDWAFYAPAPAAPTAPSSLFVGRSGLAYPTAIFEDAVSMPYHMSRRSHGAVHHSRPQSQVNVRQYHPSQSEVLSDSKVLDQSMETLDRKIPPSVRPLLGPEASKRHSSGLLLSSSETRSDFLLNRCSNSRQQQYRKSCDLHSAQQHDPAPSSRLRGQEGCQGALGFRSKTQGDIHQLGASEEVSSSSGRFTASTAALSTKDATPTDLNHNSRSSRKTEKKFAKSTDGVHHLYQNGHLKRSYPELREAASEVGMFKDSSALFETATNVSTVIASQSVVSNTNATTIRKGLLWQQRDKLFSRWKERFFILTQDYLQCFKRGTSRMTEMGGFIFKLKLSDVSEVELLDKKGYMIVCLNLARDGKVLLRKPEGIRDWFQDLKTFVAQSKERKGLMKSSKEFWSKKHFSSSAKQHRYGGRSSSAHETRKTDYGFIDAPPEPDLEANSGRTTATTAASTAEQNTQEPQSSSVILPQKPGPQVAASSSLYGTTTTSSSGSSSGHDKEPTGKDSASNQSQDSGIDSIEKPGRTCSSSEARDEMRQVNKPRSRSKNRQQVRPKPVVAASSDDAADLALDSELLDEVMESFPSLWQKKRPEPGLEANSGAALSHHRPHSSYYEKTSSSDFGALTKPQSHLLPHSKPQVTKL